MQTELLGKLLSTFINTRLTALESRNEKEQTDLVAVQTHFKGFSSKFN